MHVLSIDRRRGNFVIWALLALLGIPLWFIAVILVVVFLNRRQVRSSPDVFKFYERKGEGWTRRPGYARLVSDVVIVHQGPALVRTDARQVTDVEVFDRLDEAPKKLDAPATELIWTFADAETRRAAIATSDLDLARPVAPAS